MDYKLFIDDLRFPVEPDWFVARSSSEAIEAIKIYGMPSHIAFDHDLGGEDTTRIFCKELEVMLCRRDVYFPKEFSYSIHSANPIGVNWISEYMSDLLDHYK